MSDQATRAFHPTSGQRAASRWRRAPVAAAAAAAALAGSPAAWAQTAPPAAAQPDKVQSVVVTGSRIRSLDATSISPVTSLGAIEIEQRGVLRVEDLLNTLPQAYADQTGGGNRGGTVGASGTATVNLRNLGNQRTLVLIDGRRLMQGDPARSTAQAPDINNIPPSLIERVDIVTGGASAVYGSDALAGVVNFIMKRNFEGLRFDAQGSAFQHGNGNPIADAAVAAGQPVPTGNTWGGGQQGLSVTFGRNFGSGRGNVTAFLGYRQLAGVGTSERDFMTCNLTATATGYGCSLSSTTYPGQFQLTNPTTGVVRSTVALDPTTGNTFRTYRTSDGFNNGNTYDLQAPTKRTNANVFANYRFSDALEAYGEVGAMRNRVDIRLSPTGVFTVAQRIPCANPFLSAQQVSQLCTSVGLTAAQDATVLVSYRNALGGSRHDTTDHDSIRLVTGLRGDLSSSWRYDGYVQYGRTAYDSRLTNEISLARFARAMTAVRDSSGRTVCRSVVDGSDPSCVPFNIWQIGGVSQQALDYVGSVATRTGSLRQAVASLALTGDLGVTSPWAVQPLALAVGAEYRKEAIRFQPDASYTSRDTAGNSGGEFPISGSFDVKEAYAELRVPIAENKPWAKSLALEAGYRRSSYSTAGSTDAWKLAGDWAPGSQLRVRGGLQRAVRAPYLSELFGPQRVVTAAISDPCESSAPRATLVQCQGSGVTAAQYGNIAPAAGQQSGAQVGGNTKLVPETSDTVTAGLQLTPAALPGWAFSVDYFRIQVDQLIANVPANITLTQCINAGQFCNLISRNPTTGSLVTGGYVVTTSINSGYLKTSGVDIAVNGSLPLSSFGSGLPGKLTMNLSSTWLARYEVQILPGTDAYRCDGYFGVNCGVPLPKWRHRASLGWVSPGGFGVVATVRFVGATANDRTSTATFLRGTFQPYDATLAARHYLDLAATWDVDKRLTLRVGVNNLGDKDPPLTASTGGAVASGPVYPGIHDVLGRQLFASATLKF
jgi:outer membrane receptor protein involved in Fe transport